MDTLTAKTMRYVWLVSVEAGGSLDVGIIRCVLMTLI